MVKKMNKKGFIGELSKLTNYSEEECRVINEILENNFFLSKRSKDKILDDFTNRLGIDCKEANRIYDVALKIINDEIRDKLSHSFVERN